MEFRATIELGGKTATGFAVPDDVVEQLGAGKRPKVKVTIGTHTYRSTIAKMDGRFLLPLSADNRTAAGVQAGDIVDVRLELDTDPREVTIPDDFATALRRTPGAKKAFDALSYTHRKEHVRAIEDAKKPDTRQRRIDNALRMLTENTKD